MNETFQVGEIAIYVRPGSPYYGQEVTIIGPLKLRGGPSSHDHITGQPAQRDMKYLISNPVGFNSPNGKGFSARPENLRKKKPPQRDIDQLVSWDDCVWRPGMVHV